MSKKEISRFKSAVQDHFLDTGTYSHILVNMPYANVLKEELNCTEPQFAQCLEIKNLSIVDGLEEDFVIIP